MLASETHIHQLHGQIPLKYRLGTSDEIVISEFEQDQYQMRRLVREGQHWLDLGANIGLFCLAAAHAGATVEAFEPDPDNFQILIENVMTALRIDTWPVAVTHDGGRVNLHRPDDEHWHVMTRSDPAGMPTFSLRSLITDGCCVKMDVEGAEHRLIVRTPVKTWKRVQTLVMEYHLDRLSIAEWSEARSHLVQAGFQLSHPQLDATTLASFKRLEQPFIVVATRD